MKRTAWVSVLAAAALAFGVWSTGGRFLPDSVEPDVSLISTVNAKETPSNPAPKAQRKVVAYYFHGNYRCVSCKRIEAWTSETLKKDFTKDIAAGRLEWRVVNVDVKGNEHYMKDYKLYTKSVVLSDTKNGKETRYKNLDKVWNLLGNEAAFRKYVRDEVSAYLKGA